MSNEIQDKEDLEHAPFWMGARLSDIQNMDFEEPIRNANLADAYELSKLYRDPVVQKQSEETYDLTSADKVHNMLAGVLGMHAKPSDRSEPYGPFIVFADGSRSATVDDFIGEPLQLLIHAAEQATHPTLKARLCDVCWFIERSRFDLGTAAVSAYVEIIEKLSTNEIIRQNGDKEGFGLTEKDILVRTLQIAKLTGWERDSAKSAQDWVVKFRKEAIEREETILLCWFSELDLDYGISNPAEVAQTLEAYLKTDRDTENLHADLSAWRLAARAYHFSKNDDAKRICQIEAAECLVKQAEGHSSAMLASHWLSCAIAEYHGLSACRERRTELRHKLIDVQANITEEISSFSNSINIEDIIQQTEKTIKDLNLLETLLVFASLEKSPNPSDLKRDAIKSIEEHPMASMFGTSFYDKDGLVTHRSEGGGLRDTDNNDAIRITISQQEGIRRQLHAKAQVDVARRVIVENFYLSENTFIALLEYSPFVPAQLRQTFALGIVRFFQGDAISSLYILTPLLESSLRHILKMHGHDVTIFDDKTQTQEARSITSMFDAMRDELNAIFGESIIADLEGVFLSKPGPSIRHAIAHGLLNDGSPYGPDATYACWFIFRLCCMPLFSDYKQIILP